MSKNTYIKLLKKQNSRFKILLKKLNIVSDDNIYIRYFENKIASKLHRMHLKSDYISCIFCRHLSRSNCHEYCFICTKNTYTECSCLLPGTLSFNDSYFSVSGHKIIPWIFRTPCTYFERLDENKYFKNFVSRNSFITAENFEVLEGLFTGFTHRKRPCHICASVNINIYNKCAKNGEIIKHKPCPSILEAISSEYRVATGMVRYM